MRKNEELMRKESNLFVPMSAFTLVPLPVLVTHPLRMQHMLVMRCPGKPHQKRLINTYVVGLWFE